MVRVRTTHDATRLDMESADFQAIVDLGYIDWSVRSVTHSTLIGLIHNAINTFSEVDIFICDTQVAT